MDERTAAAPVADVDLELYRRLVDASPVPVAVIAPDATVHVWNPAAARLFGWPAADVLGRPIAIVTTGLWNAHVGSSRVDLQACKLEYSIVSPK